MGWFIFPGFTPDWEKKPEKPQDSAAGGPGDVRSLKLTASLPKWKIDGLEYDDGAKLA